MSNGAVLYQNGLLSGCAVCRMIQYVSGDGPKPFGSGIVCSVHRQYVRENAPIEASAAVGALYIQPDQLPNPHPETLTVKLSGAS